MACQTFFSKCCRWSFAYAAHPVSNYLRTVLLVHRSQSAKTFFSNRGYMPFWPMSPVLILKKFKKTYLCSMNSKEKTLKLIYNVELWLWDCQIPNDLNLIPLNPHMRVPILSDNFIEAWRSCRCTRSAIWQTDKFINDIFTILERHLILIMVSKAVV